MRVTEGFETDGVDDCWNFGFGFGRADSLLTLTDAGICNKISFSSWAPWQPTRLESVTSKREKMSSTTARKKIFLTGIYRPILR
jgi:hypothetical protein